MITGNILSNQNSQYFVKSVLEVSKAQETGKTIRKLQENLLIHTVQNVTIVKKTYQSLCKYFEQNLYLTVENLTTKEFAEINDDFNRENFWASITLMNLIVG